MYESVKRDVLIIGNAIEVNNIFTGTDLNLLQTKSSQNSSETSSQNLSEMSNENLSTNSSENLSINSSQKSSENSEFLVSPVAYSYMYIQWEANETISHELIRNIGLTFATIAIVSLVLIMNLQVSTLNIESTYIHIITLSKFK